MAFSQRVSTVECYGDKDQGCPAMVCARKPGLPLPSDCESDGTLVLSSLHMVASLPPTGSETEPLNFEQLERDLVHHTCGTI